MGKKKVRQKKKYDQTLGFRSEDDIKKAEKYLGSASSSLPLPQSFFLTSILGLVISAALTISGKLSPSWGFSFCLVFVMMFIASFVSMTPRGSDL
jgi:hypothetical protein